MISAPALVVQNLFAGYEAGVPIVRGASIQVSRGEIVSILGPNGAGKSTLVKAIAGMVEKFSGSVFLDGVDITRSKAHEMARNGLAFVPQTENVFVTMTVEENLQVAAALLPKNDRRKRLQSVLELFPDIARQISLRAGRLSGGQRQMLALARALMIAPKVLTLDEASAGLSPRLVEIVFSKIKEIAGAGMAIVLVEQNVRAALAVSDRAYVLVEGENQHEGSSADLSSDAAIGMLYLGAGNRLASAEPGQ
jgi:branched-chain amino acid transport system ATP-binding protein